MIIGISILDYGHDSFAPWTPHACSVVWPILSDVVSSRKMIEADCALQIIIDRHLRALPSIPLRLRGPCRDVPAVPIGFRDWI